MCDISLQELLKTHQTPMYLFDLNKVKNRISTLREALPDNVELCYAVKANTFILQEVSNLVDRLEICSPGELQICQKLKLPEEKFVISGVYKDPALMHQMIAQCDKIGIYTVESMQQFTLLYDAAKEVQKPISVLLRLTSGNQFGLDKSEIEQIVTRFGNDSLLDIKGIQYFSGTQKSSLKRLKRELNTVDSFISTLGDEYKFQVRELEFGPGFPVTYFEGDDFDEESFFLGFQSLLTEMQFKGSITLELGRSIAASCGSYLTRVVDTKCNHAQNYAIVDGGMHQLVYYGQSMAMKQPHVRLLTSHAGGEDKEWNICGSLCTINDILVKQLPLGNLQISDVLVFENTGAYCMTEGISLFLSRDLPEVILVNLDGSVSTVRDHMSTSALNTPIK